jgi:uncharacterized protein YkwD
VSARFVVQALLALLILIAAACLVPDQIQRCLAEGQAQPVVGPRVERSPGEIEAEILRRINVERARAGLKPLALDPLLVETARQRSRDMAVRGYFDHRDPETNALLFHQALKERGIYGGAENLFLTSQSRVDASQDAVEWWMDSRTHYENVMRSGYRRTGVGVAIRAQHIYVTQLFL